MVYRDEHVAEASAAQKLLADYAPASKATYDVAELARNIVARLPEPDTTALRDQRSSAGWRR
jgi:MinD-like ATPase involved in chromosome partitioning or flagellar assembly